MAGISPLKGVSDSVPSSFRLSIISKIYTIIRTLFPFQPGSQLRVPGLPARSNHPNRGWLCLNTARARHIHLFQGGSGSSPAGTIHLYREGGSSSNFDTEPLEHGAIGGSTNYRQRLPPSPVGGGWELFCHFIYKPILFSSSRAQRKTGLLVVNVKPSNTFMYFTILSFTLSYYLRFINTTASNNGHLRSSPQHDIAPLIQISNA